MGSDLDVPLDAPKHRIRSEPSQSEGNGTMIGLMMTIAPQDEGLSHLTNGHDRRPEPNSGSSKQADHYAQIGQTLLTCEAVFYNVGIPWLPPTGRVSSLRRQCDQPLRDFVRCALVTVTTSSMESYLDDLESLPAGQESSEKLHIEITSPIERHLFAVLTGLVTASVALFSLQTLSLTPLVTSIATLCVTAVGVAVAEYLSIDLARRVTFEREILAELNRRKGADNPSLTRLPLYPVGSK